ncbi:MAG TPA: nucleoside-diphosphate sugar epimerase/dehydratase [Ilumatobacteraceae bacterium]|nr:nucleoside-diphosphate sugar epimerase/dehydratase [Ilumatobacteraceae bacterium]
MPLTLLDAMLVAGSYTSLLAVRFDGQIPSAYSHRMFQCLPLVVGVHITSNLVWGLYGQIWRHASIAEARRVVLAGITAGVIIYPFDPLESFPVPRSVALFAAVVATMFMGLVRFQARLFSWRRKVDRTGTPVAVVGAGVPGASIIREMARSPMSRRYPVVVVDDDVRTHGRSLLGVPVVGSVANLERAIERFRAREVLVADPGADQILLRTAMEAAERAKVPVKVFPPVHELLTAAPSVRDVRELQIDDLLGRQQVVTDRESIRATIASRRVLITGAGGSIGSEIAAQVATYEPSLLVLLDHDETHLHELSARMPPTVNQQLVLTDIRDRVRLQSVFERVRPEVVFHAAAHKHVPLLEADPVEAIKTNVWGTENVLQSAASVFVERLVFISSDKAVRPSNVLGRSKHIGEQLVVSRAPAGARWCSVRFGNVIGSRGSVIPTFAAQIAGGGPVTVTDPHMTRYFMSVYEAVTLALQAAVFSSGGEIFMLNVGEQVNVLELAERMIRLSGRVVGDEVPIEFVGARPGEKLSEQLQDIDEEAHPTNHSAITRLVPIALGGDRMDRTVEQLGLLAARGRDDEIRRLLDELTITDVETDAARAPMVPFGGTS